MRVPAVPIVVMLAFAGRVAAAEHESRNAPTRDAAALTQLIDRRIDEGLKAAGIPASPAADDAEFLRRIYLDLHGVVPTAEQVQSFLHDGAADKRARLVDQLLTDPRFAVHLADVWDDYLIPVADDPRTSKDRLNAWLEEAFETKNWDRIVRELLTAAGRRDRDAVVVYLLKGRETLTPAELTDLVSQYFLGMRLNCAQCHDHPFTSWKRSDYWGLAAFFTQIQYTDRRLQKSGLIRDDPAVDLNKLENADLLRTPQFLLGEVWKPQSGVPHRTALADWIVSPENPYFARAMVNRMWWQLFGCGLVEPVDDMHQDNPPTHPELLAELTRRFADSGFDLRHLCRAVCNSDAYRRTSMPTAGNERDATFYSRMAVKVLTPEQLFDSLQVVVPPGPESKRYERSGNPREEFVRFFRSEGDPQPTAYDRGIPQTLRMMNAPQLFSSRTESATIRRVVEAAASEAQIIDALYLRVLARFPRDEERKILDDYLARHQGPREAAYAEIMWSLLNGSEFSLNH